MYPSRFCRNIAGWYICETLQNDVNDNESAESAVTEVLRFYFSKAVRYDVRNETNG